MVESSAILTTLRNPPRTLTQWRLLSQSMDDLALVRLSREVARAPVFEQFLDMGLSNIDALYVMEAFLDALLTRGLPIPDGRMLDDGIDLGRLDHRLPQDAPVLGLSLPALDSAAAAYTPPWAWFAPAWAWGSPHARLAHRVAPNAWMLPRDVSLQRYDGRTVHQADVALERLVDGVAEYDVLGLRGLRVHGAPWVPVLHHPAPWWTEPSAPQPYRNPTFSLQRPVHPLVFEGCAFVSNHAADGYAGVTLDTCAIRLPDGLVVEFRAPQTAWLWIDPATLMPTPPVATPLPTRADAPPPPDELFPRLPDLRFVRLVLQPANGPVATVVALDRIPTDALRAAGFPMLEALRTPQSGESVLREDAKRAVLWQELLQIVSPLNKVV